MKKMIKRILCLFQKIRLRKKCRFGISCDVFGGSTFEGENKMGSKCYFVSSSLGYGSYMGDNNVFKNARIGRFCSLASNIKVVSAAHPSSVFVSSHPAFFSNLYNDFSFAGKVKFNESLSCEDGHSVIIGNDVWVGENVLIKGGVTIGDGAIVAMGSVVIKDVEPYSVVGGVPARIIRYRFEKNQIDFLLEFKWWQKSAVWLKSHSDLFENIEKFIIEAKDVTDENM